MIITVMAGISGSGKSTYTQKMNQPICSTDKFVDDYAKKHNINYSDSFDLIQKKQLFGTITELFYAEITNHIKNDVDFVVDRTNLTSGSRKALIDFIKHEADSFGQKYVLKYIYFSIDEKTLFERLEKRLNETGKGIPLDVVKQQIDVWETPQINDGFDYVENCMI